MLIIVRNALCSREIEMAVPKLLIWEVLKPIYGMKGKSMDLKKDECYLSKLNKRNKES
jgi:hypothetical protein